VGRFESHPLRHFERFRKVSKKDRRTSVGEGLEGSERFRKKTIDLQKWHRVAPFWH